MTTESQIAAWLAGQQDAMVALLREMVDIDSGSYCGRRRGTAVHGRARHSGGNAAPAEAR